MRRLVWLVAAWFGLASGALAQTLPLPAPKETPTPVEVPEALANPRATMQTFLDAMNRGDADAAAQTLDLSTLPAVERPNLGRLRANLLFQTLNRTALVQVGQIPDRTDAPFVYRAYRSSAGETVGRIEIGPGADGAWRFTTETVEALPQIWAVVRDWEIVYGPAVSERQFAPGLWFEGKVPDGLRGVALGLRVYQWIGLAVLVVGGWVLARVLAWVIAGSLRALRRLFPHGLAERHRTGFARQLGLVLTSLAVLEVVPYLNLPVWVGAFFVGTAKLVMIAAGASSAWYVVDALLDRAQKHAESFGERAQKLFFPFAAKLCQIGIVAVAVVVALAAFGINVTALVAGLGIGGLVVAFAAKDSIENVFGSFTILFDMPFAVGDWVRIGDIDGNVEEINLRSTRIRTFADSLITLPNSTLIKASVENFGRRRVRRLKTTLGLEYSTPPEKLEAYARAVDAMLAARDDVSPEKRRVYVYGLEDSSISIFLECFLIVPDYDGELKARSEIVRAILELAAEHGVSFAFPTRTVFLACE